MADGRLGEAQKGLEVAGAHPLVAAATALDGVQEKLEDAEPVRIGEGFESGRKVVHPPTIEIEISTDF